MMSTRIRRLAPLVVVLAALFGAGWTLGGLLGGPAQAQTILSHFKCYKILGGHNPPQVVDLEDQFHFEKDVRVNRAKLLCTPVFKTNVRPPGFPDPPQADHLKCYAIRQPDLVPPPVVTLANQFGVESNVSVVRPKFLCVPTVKAPTG